jgi:phosphatidylserine synthase
MKKYEKWMMISKMNALVFLMPAAFMSITAFGFADNRFEHELWLYIMILVLWLLAGLNLVGYALIKKLKHKDLNIPLWIKIILGSMMVGFIVISINYPGGVTVDLIHEYQHVSDIEKK